LTFSQNQIQYLPLFIFKIKCQKKNILQKRSTKSLGDLSENAEYHEARENQGLIEDRIKKIDLILKNAVIVSSHKTESVGVGAVITVIKEGDKNEKTYTVVGGEESDIAAGKISINSPFGQAAMGKRKGDKFTFQAPAGPVTYKIIEIK
jgi:transcription elongation factor GreA